MSWRIAGAVGLFAASGTLVFTTVVMTINDQSEAAPLQPGATCPTTTLPGASTTVRPTTTVSSSTSSVPSGSTTVSGTTTIPGGGSTIPGNATTTTERCNCGNN